MSTQTRPAGWRSQEDYDGFMQDFLAGGNGVCVTGPDGLNQHVPLKDFLEPQPCPVCGQSTACKPNCGWARIGEVKP